MRIQWGFNIVKLTSKLHQNDEGFQCQFNIVILMSKLCRNDEDFDDKIIRWREFDEDLMLLF